MNSRLNLALALSVAVISGAAQEITGQQEHSSEIIRRGVKLHDEEKYDDAIAEYKKVHRNDSNYYLAGVEILTSMMAAKKYEEGLGLCEHLLKLRNDYTPNVLVYKGDFLDYLGKSDEARSVFAAGRKDYPLNHSFYFEESVLRLQQKKYDEGFDFLVLSARVNPFHPATHFQLAVLAQRNNNLAATMLAYQYYLICDAVSKRAQKVVVNLEKIARLELEPDSILSMKAFQNGNDLSEMESLLRSKFALGDKFKDKTGLNYDLLKQMQLLIENIGKYKSEKGFYNEFYGRFFADLNAEKHTETYLYYSLKGMGVEKVNKWLEKNKSEVERFETWCYNYVCMNFAKFSENLNGKVAAVPHWYNNNSIAAAGEKNAAKENNGYWNFYYRNGIRRAEGEYVSGAKHGMWKYYSPNGNLDKEEVFDKGSQTLYRKYYDNNNLKVEVKLDKGTVTGEKKVYYSNGNVYSTTPYVNGKENGMQTFYFRNGATRYSISNVEDVVNGDLKEYYDNGKLYQQVKFVNSNREGPAKYYYNNAGNTLKSEGSYVKNKEAGEWKYYHDNGTVSETRIYDDGVLDGTNKEYHEDGKLKTDDNYSKGKLNGLCRNYSEEGKLWEEYVYKKGKLLEYRAFRPDGTKICDNAINGKNFAVVLYHPNGTKRREGAVSDGDLHGIWKEYNMFGLLTMESTYEEGRLHGKRTQYHPNGKVRSESGFARGEETGRYRSFHINGTPNTEGEMVNGEKNGYWITYYRDGTLASREYYNEGDLEGWNEYYDVAGKIHSEELHREACLVKVIHFDTVGTVSRNMDFPGGTGVLERYGLNGERIFKRSIVKNMAEGESVAWYPDGKLLSKIIFKNGKREGLLEEFDALGVMVSKTNFFNNQKNGVEEDFTEDGKVESRYNYRNGEYHGRCLIYHANGKISRDNNYNDGELEGEADMMDDMGELIYKRYFHNDLLIGYTYYDASGKLLPRKTLPAGESTVTCYYKNGKKSLEAGYLNGDLHGKRKVFSSSGKLMSESEFYYGASHGASREYSASGTVLSVRNYHYGRLTGKSETFYDNGTRRSEVNYRNGERHGWTRYYDRSGKLMKSVYYYNDWPVKNG
jgi:uncharacterized protein